MNDKGSALVQEKSLQSLIEETVEELFLDIAKIHLRQYKKVTGTPNDLCTVYTTFSGGYNVRFVFCAERTFMKRITENISEEPVKEPDDIEEYMKEFINVICGHIVASVFRKTKKSARFHCPRFKEGFYLPPPGGAGAMITTYYIDEYSETAILSNDRFSVITH